MTFTLYSYVVFCCYYQLRNTQSPYTHKHYHSTLYFACEYSGSTDDFELRDDQPYNRFNLVLTKFQIPFWFNTSAHVLNCLLSIFYIDSQIQFDSLKLVVLSPLHYDNTLTTFTVKGMEEF